MANIKLGIRKNLFYPMMIIIIDFVRKIDLIFLDTNKIAPKIFKELKNLLMFLSEFISGFIIFKYQLNFISKKSMKRVSKLMGIKLMDKIKKTNKKEKDQNCTIFFYIFIVAFLDFIGFMISNYDISLFDNVFSPTLEIRLKSLYAILSSLFCFFLLQFPIYRHQKCSLIFILLFLIIIIILEYIFVSNKTLNINDLTLELLFILIQDIFYSFIDVIEKYLLDYDSVNPFQMLMFEGIFGFIIFSISIIINTSFQNIFVSENEEEVGVGNLILFIIGLIAYFLLSGAYNSYRVVINKLYSPITLSLTYCFLDPLFIIFYENYGIKDNNTLKRYNYIFIINIILSFFIVFCICIYNEIFVLFCFNLEKDTYHEISNRSYFEIIEALSEQNDETFSIELG